MIPLKPYYQRDGITIYHGDSRKILPAMPRAQFVFDDPPYLEGDQSDLLALLLNVGERVVVTPGKLQSFNWIRRQAPVWEYAWKVSTKSLGGSACLHIGWEPVLAYQFPLRPVGNDVLDYTIIVRAGAKEHPWPKPLLLMKKIVAHWSNVGDLIIDPHAGSGTTLMAAKELGRRAIGIEINEKFCELCVRQVESVNPMPLFVTQHEQLTFTE